jgi:hypothetical protein
MLAVCGLCTCGLPVRRHCIDVVDGVDMNRKIELQKTIAKARQELDEILDAEYELGVKNLVGKFFKFRNSYSGDKDPWWLFLYVYRLNEGSADGWSFQKDCYGKIDFDTEKYFRLLSGYIEIDAKEFWEEYDKIMAELKALGEKRD